MNQQDKFRKFLVKNTRDYDCVSSYCWIHLYDKLSLHIWDVYYILYIYIKSTIISWKMYLVLYDICAPFSMYVCTSQQSKLKIRFKYDIKFPLLSWMNLCSFNFLKNRMISFLDIVISHRISNWIILSYCFISLFSYGIARHSNFYE